MVVVNRPHSQAYAESSRPRSYRHAAIALTGLTLIVLAAYSNIVFRGESLVSTTNANPIDDRWDGGGYENWHDQGAVWWQWEPAAQFFSRAYRAASLPFWDPTVAGGVNSHVNLTQGQYFLPYVLLLVAGNSPVLRDVYYLLMLLGSGAACFLLLWRNGFHVTSGLFMATGWVLGGTMTQNINAIFGQTYATLPWLALAVDVLLDRLRWRAWGAAALIIGLSTYSAFLPIVIAGYVLVGIQTVVYVLAGWRNREAGNRTVALAAFTSAVLVALGIAAFLLLPLVDAQRDSAAFHAGYMYAGLGHYSWDILPTIFSPRLFYNVWQTIPNEAAFIPNPTSFPTNFFYIGTTVVLLATCIKHDDRILIRRLQWFFAASAVVLLLKLMGIAPVQWLAYLPVFRFLHFTPYFSGAFAFAVVGLAACGVEGLVRSGDGRRQLAALGSSSLAVAASIPLFVMAVGSNEAQTPETITAAVLYGRELVRVVLVVGGLVLIVWLRTARRLDATVTGVALIGLVCLELGPIAFHGRSKRTDIWNVDLPAYVRSIKSDPGLFRVGAVHYPSLVPNTFQGVGIAGISSLGVFNAARYTELIDAHFDTRKQSGFIAPTVLLPRQRTILDLLNVKYLVTYDAGPEQRIELEAAGLVPAFSDRRFAVHRNPTVWPRAFVVHDYQVVADRASAIRAAGSSTSDVAIVEQRPGFPAGGGPATRCQIIHYGANEIRVVGNDASAGMLVVLDSFARGWTATVNGVRSPIVPAYGAFRGIEVPDGRWEVRLEYEPPLVRAGAIISALSVAIALVALRSKRLLRRCRRAAAE